MMMVHISVKMHLETHIHSHLNKNKVNIKSVTLRPAPYMLRYLKLNVYNFCIINVKSFKLWHLICEMHMERSYKFHVNNLELEIKSTIYQDNPRKSITKHTWSFCKKIKVQRSKNDHDLCFSSIFVYLFSSINLPNIVPQSSIVSEKCTVQTSSLTLCTTEFWPFRKKVNLKKLVPNYLYHIPRSSVFWFRRKRFSGRSYSFTPRTGAAYLFVAGFFEYLRMRNFSVFSICSHCFRRVRLYC